MLIEAGESSLLSSRIPVLLSACQRATTTTELTMLYQLRFRLSFDLAASPPRR